MPLLARDLAFAYGRTGPQVLRAVSCEVRPGRITAIIGPNGAGKSTLLRLLLGLLTPTAGACELDGATVAGLSERQRARRLAYVPQVPSIALAFTAADVVALGRYAIDGGGTRPSHAAVERALARVGSADAGDTPFASLSVGQRQRVILARALAQLDHAGAGERYLLADEPFSAMDPRHVEGSISLFRELARDGLAIAVVLHDLGAVQAIADDVLVMDGRAGARQQEGLDPAELSRVYETEFLRWTSERGHEMVHAAGRGRMGTS